MQFKCREPNSKCKFKKVFGDGTYCGIGHKPQPKFIQRAKNEPIEILSDQCVEKKEGDGNG